MNKKIKELIVDEKLFNIACENYFLWKELNTRIKEIYSRGVNLHESITEMICSYVNNFKICFSNSADAINDLGEKIQIKATSNFNDDLTSFGPKSQFKYLHFLRLNQKEDKLYLYEINIDNLKMINVNKSETFDYQQKAKRRPRFSIIKQIIEKQSITYYAIVDLKNKKVNRR